MNPKVDIEVGSGPVTKAGWVGQVIAWLTFLLGLVTTISGTLPEGVDPAVGATLTVGAGVLATAINALLGLSRAKFAEAKAMVMSGQSAYDLFVDSLDLEDLDPNLPEVPEEPTDTNVTPPVEPQD